MCMSRERMTRKRANFELFLIFMRFIRSIFFNLFMLGLGFFLGAGFCMGVVKARNKLSHLHDQEICQKIGGNCDFCVTNETKTAVMSGDPGGKSDF